MKNIAAVLLLAFGLAGCAQLQTAFNAIGTATASISNPVTPDMLNNVENGAIIAFAGLKAYKQSCANGAIPQSCRATIQKIQVYTRRLPPLLATLRAFVRSNDQVNAVIAYNTVLQLTADFKSVATANSIPTGAN
jgi:hypothetical protein